MESAPTNSTTLCPKCSEGIEPDSHFCRYCAFDITSVKTQADAIPSTQENEGMTLKEKLVLIGPVVVLMFFGLWAVFFYDMNSSRGYPAGSRRPKDTLYSRIFGGKLNPVRVNNAVDKYSNTINLNQD